MTNLLYQLHKCLCLIPKQYTINKKDTYLVWKSFSIPFSRDIDLEFEDIDWILFYIGKYILWSNDELDKKEIKDILKFDKKKYISAFDYNIKFIDKEEFCSYEKQIIQDWEYLIEEVDKLINMFKIYYLKINNI